MILDYLLAFARNRANTYACSVELHGKFYTRYHNAPTLYVLRAAYKGTAARLLCAKKIGTKTEHDFERLEEILTLDSCEPGSSLAARDRPSATF